VVLDKPLESITETDLEGLLDNGVAEGKTIEYKRSLPGNTHDDKKEFLADVSSFANAVGGYLVFGIREESGVPVEICGLQDIDSDAEVLRLENMIRDNIEPRIPGVSMRPVPLQASGMVIVIRVPRSWAQPHVVSFRKHWRFYSRNSAGKYPLDVSELRAAVLLSETIADRMRLFRSERLGKIIAGETPVALGESAKIVLHIVPMSVFDPVTKYDVSLLAQNSNWPAPIRARAFDHRYNFDGLLTYTPASGRAPTNGSGSYLQIFRDGSIEAVEATLLSRGQDGRATIPSVAYEGELRQALPRFLASQKQLGVEPPLLIMLSLLGVYGYVMAVSREQFLWDQQYPIDRNDLIIPETMIEDFNCILDEVMRPAFDAVWNATGWPQSMNYDKNGKWTGRYPFA